MVIRSKAMECVDKHRSRGQNVKEANQHEGSYFCLERSIDDIIILFWENVETL